MCKLAVAGGAVFGSLMDDLEAPDGHVFIENHLSIGTSISLPGVELFVNGDISCNTLRDASGNIGTSGQVLSSTGSGLSWADTTEHGPWTTSGSDIYYNAAG